MMYENRKERKWIMGLVLLILSMTVTCYLMIELDDILEFRTSIPTKTDMVIGTLIVVLLIGINWIVFGKTFTIVSLVAIGYLLFGRYLPDPFTVPAISYRRLLMWLSVELGTGKGVYGEILDLSATYLFLFIFFGGSLHAMGGTRFIIGFGRWIGSKLQSGPAMVALFGSTLLGTVTGSTAANITITGSFTIPMMKKAGFSPEQAGAIETVSSNGGQITPPIMGATAFLMAGYADIPYLTIVLAAIIPALIKFTCVFLYITLTAKKMNVRARIETVSLKSMLLDSPIFFLPLSVLVFLLVKGFTLPFVGFWSIVTLTAVGLFSSLMRKDARLDFRETLEKIVASIVSASGIAVICGLLGVVVTAIISSGLAIKLPLAIEDLSHGILPIALVITMLCSMLLGIGLPTPAAYLVVAVGAVPGLLNMGVPRLPAHLFCFYSAITSHITPPIAIGALVASQIANSDYWQTAFESMKAAFAKYLLPFFFIYTPVVMLRPDGGVLDSILQLSAILMIIVTLQVGVSRFCFQQLERREIFVFITAAIFSIGYVFTKNNYFFVMGLILLLVGMGSQVLKSRRGSL
jgi:TRAP transporter 4TM/12TM fusion protein